MGSFVSEGTADKAFFKVLPKEEHKEIINKFVSFEEYELDFKKDIGSQPSLSQQKRLLAKSPNKDSLIKEYGYHA